MYTFNIRSWTYFELLLLQPLYINDEISYGEMKYLMTYWFLQVYHYVILIGKWWKLLHMRLWIA